MRPLLTAIIATLFWLVGVMFLSFWIGQRPSAPKQPCCSMPLQESGLPLHTRDYYGLP